MTHLQVGVLVRRPAAQLLQAPLLRLLEPSPLDRLRVHGLRRRPVRRVSLVQVLRRGGLGLGLTLG